MSDSTKRDHFVLVIDAGHGGKDIGAQGEYALEKDINLNVALDLMRRFRGHKDVKVVMTRQADEYLTLDERAQMANEKEADLFVSIHTNSSEFNKLARGTETYFVGNAVSQSATRVANKENNSAHQFEKDYDDKYQNTFLLESARMRNMNNSELIARLVQEEYIKAGARVNRGIQQAHFYVLMNTMMPAILTEVGFISTWDEESYLTSQKGVEEVAGSIYRAILTYKNTVAENLVEKKLHALKDADNAHVTANIPMKLDESMGIYDEATHRLALDKEQTKTTTKAVDKTTAKATEKTPIKVAEKLTAQTVDKTTVKKVDNKLYFYIQLMAVREPLEKQDKRLQGLWPMHYIKKGEFYKCLYFKNRDYKQVRQKLKEVKQTFPAAYVVAYEGDQEIPVAEAKERK